MENPAEHYGKIVSLLQEAMTVSKDDCVGFSTDAYIRRYRTIGFHTANDPFVRFWIGTYMRANPDTIVVVYDKDIKKNFVAMNVTNETEADRVITCKSIDEFEKLGMPSSSMIPRPGATIIVDKSEYVFDAIKKKKFYNFIARTAGPDGLVIFVD